MDTLDNGADFPARSPEEVTAAFCADVAKFAGGPAQLAIAMIRLGDTRKADTISRSIQRMMSGGVRVSGEMVVVMNILRQEHFRLNRLLSEAEWTESSDRVSAQVGDYAISIYPATKGRWRSNLVHRHGYSPSWPTWQYSLDNAKRAAIQRLIEAEVELDEIWAHRHEPEA